MPGKIDILGVKIDQLDLSEALQYIVQVIKEGGRAMIVTANPEIVMKARREPRFAEILSEADLITADGVGLIIAAKIFGTPLKGRVTGIDLIQALFEIGSREGYRFYFLGAREEVVKQAVANVRAKYPGIVMAGYHHGYFQDDEDGVLADIKASRPHILLAALGMGKQEAWISAHQAELGIPVAIGVGGSFDVLAGAVKRAPVFMQRLGLEWLYRLITQPSRFFRMLELPKFLFLVLAKKIFR